MQRSRLRRRMASGKLMLLAAALSVSTAAAGSLMLNEVEVNPAGLDGGKEWVEILNPSEQPIDLAGWSISYVYRGPGTIPLVEGARVLGPGERFVFVYPRIALRNAGPNVLRLIDPAGVVIDATSPLADTADDERSWQRFPDGGDPWFPDLWLFLPATRGAPNS